MQILRDWGADVRAQLTDEFMRKQVPTCSGVEDVREQLFEATQQETALSTQNRVVEALGKAVAEIVDTDVPEFLVRSMGEQMCAPCDQSAPGPTPQQAFFMTAQVSCLRSFSATVDVNISLLWGSCQPGRARWHVACESRGLSCTLPKSVRGRSSRIFGSSG